MKAVQVTFTIKEDCCEEFIKQTLINVENSQKESGVKNFIFFQKTPEDHIFFLMEVYYSVEDQLKHRETDHYINWKKNILQLLEKPYEINELKIYS